MALLDPESPFREEEALEFLREADPGPGERGEDETDLLTPLLAEQETRAEETQAAWPPEAESSILPAEVAYAEPEEETYAFPDPNSEAPPEESLAVEEPESKLEPNQEEPFDFSELESDRETEAETETDQPALTAEDLD